MFKSILVPIDLADTDLAKPAIATAATLSQTWSGAVRHSSCRSAEPGPYQASAFVTAPALQRTAKSAALRPGHESPPRGSLQQFRADEQLDPAAPERDVVPVVGVEVDHRKARGRQVVGERVARL